MLSTVPDDVLLLIFDQIEDLQDHTALALVSRRINYRVTPYVYRSYHNTNVKHPRSFWPFLRTLLSRPVLGEYVYRVAIRPWISRQQLSHCITANTSYAAAYSREFPAGENEVYRKVLCDKSLDLREWDLETDTLHANNTPLPCEVVEAFKLLSTMPNLQELRINTKTWASNNREIIPSVPWPALIRRVEHGFPKLSSVTIDHTDGYTGEYFDALRYLLGLPSMESLVLMSPEHKNVRPAEWEYLHRACTVEDLVVSLKSPQVSLVDALVASCKALKEFAYFEPANFRLSLLGCTDPFTFDALSSAHGESLTVLGISTLHQIAFVRSGQLRRLNNLRYLHLGCYPIFGYEQPSSVSALNHLLPPNLTDIVFWCWREDCLQPLMDFAKDIDMSGSGKLQRVTVEFLRKAFAPVVNVAAWKSGRELEGFFVGLGWLCEWAFEDNAWVMYAWR